MGKGRQEFITTCSIIVIEEKNSQFALSDPRNYNPFYCMMTMIIFSL